MPEQQPFARKAAQFCLIAPLVVFGFNLIARNAARAHEGTALMIGVFSAILVLAGLVSGIIALAGIRKHGPRGILGMSIVGILLGVLCIMAVVSVFRLASRGALLIKGDQGLQEQLIGTWECRNGEGADETVIWLILSSDETYQFAATGAAVAHVSGSWSVQDGRLHLPVSEFVDGNRAEMGEKMVWSIDEFSSERAVFGTHAGQAVFSRLRIAGDKTIRDLEREYHMQQGGIYRYPMWFGMAEVSGGHILLTSWDERTEFAKEFLSSFDAPACVLVVVIDNRSGFGAIEVDPESAKLYKGEHLVTAALPPGKILPAAKEDRDEWLKKHSGTIAAAAGRKCLGRVFFLPSGTNMSEVTHVVVKANGVDTRIPGGLFSGEKMMEMYQQGVKLEKGK